MHEGIPVVTQFLFRYFLIWDGEEFRDEIFGLLSWVTDATIKGMYSGPKIQFINKMQNL